WAKPYTPYVPLGGVFIPLLSPLTNFGIRSLYYGENFQQRWMSDSYYHFRNQTCQNAKLLIETIDENAAPLPADDKAPVPQPEAKARANVSGLFFGHDDVPVVAENGWARVKEGNHVFPHFDESGWKTGADDVLGFFFRIQPSRPPEWTQQMRV